MTKNVALFALACVWMSITSFVDAHDDEKGSARFLANAGVLITTDQAKFMFDPFFHNDYGRFTTVPEQTRSAIFKGTPPYNNIDAIFITHAHEDHFNAPDALQYLTKHKQTHLYAPKQAVVLLSDLDGFAMIEPRVHIVNTQSLPFRLQLEELAIEAITVAHTGGQKHAHVENVVFRVNTNNGVAVMHFGDADTDPKYYSVHGQFFQDMRSNTAFVPFWFALNPDGQYLIDHVINADQAIAVHVPKELPTYMQTIAIDYFHEPGETTSILQTSN